MSNSDMSTCVICGKKYKACMSCKDMVTIKPWRSITDKIDCYKIFLVLSQYNNGYIDKEKAKSLLEEIEYNEKDLRESVLKTINEIRTSNKDVKKSKNSVER